MDPRARRALLALELAAVGLIGAVLGLLVAGTVTTGVGPFQAELSLTPSLSGSTVVALPPLGELELDTHDGPARLDVRVTQLRDEAARSIVADPESLRSLGDDVSADLRAGLQLLVVRTVLVTVAGAALLGLLVFRRWRATAVSGAAGLLALLLVGGASAASFDERSLAEPRYTGLLASAPTAVGDVRDLVERFDVYQLQLGRLVTNVSQLYAVTSRLPVFTPDEGTARVLFVSDLHLNPAAFRVIASVVQQFSVEAVVDTGDLTDFGSDAENRYVAQIAGLGVPYVWIRGNHDSQATQAAVAAQPNAVVLDGPEVVEVAGIGFVGQGDPRFTPDKTTRDDDAPTEVLTAVGNALRRALSGAPVQPDVVLLHDPISAGPLLGQVPLVLSGHVHERRAETTEGTLHLVQGSTGGAGLRALEGEEPTPIMLSVLYFDRDSGRLQAYDDITLGGLGDSDARIARRVVAPPVEAGPSPRPSLRPSLRPSPRTSPRPAATASPPTG